MLEVLLPSSCLEVAAAETTAADMATARRFFRWTIVNDCERETKWFVNERIC